MIKILMIPDIHLYDKDIEGTVGYAEQSVRILESIREVVSEREYDLVVLGGDIQHYSMTDMKYVSRFTKELTEISKIVTERTNKVRNMVIHGEHKGKYYGDKGRTKLYAIRGQHDTEAKGFTYYDFLEENNIIASPDMVLIDNLQINLISYDRTISRLRREKIPGMRKVINIHHNPIKWGGKFVDGDDELGVDPGVHKVFGDVDLVLVNDVHTIMKDQTIKNGTSITKIVTPGSLGRTDNQEFHKRDYGNLVEVNIDKNTYEISHKMVEIELIPSNKFFKDTEKYWDIPRVKRLIEKDRKAFIRGVKRLWEDVEKGSIKLNKEEKEIISQTKEVINRRGYLGSKWGKSLEILEKHYLDELVKIANSRKHP